MPYIVRRGFVHSHHFVVLDRWPGATLLAGVFSTEEKAREMAPMLELVDVKLAAIRKAREAAESEKAGGGVKRKAG